MFGSLAGFVNGNMFIGLFGANVFVRLPNGDRSDLLGKEGTSMFEPMKGRPMTEYVTIPDDWRQHPDVARSWVARSLAWVGQMPEKKPKRKK